MSPCVLCLSRLCPAGALQLRDGYPPLSSPGPAGGGRHTPFFYRRADWVHQAAYNVFYSREYCAVQYRTVPYSQLRACLQSTSYPSKWFPPPCFPLHASPSMITRFSVYSAATVLRW